MHQLHEELDEVQVKDSRCGRKQPQLDRGWALRVSAPNIRFNQNQVSWLDEKYSEGEATNRKHDAGLLSKEMHQILKPGCMFST